MTLRGPIVDDTRSHRILRSNHPSEIRKRRGSWGSLEMARPAAHFVWIACCVVFSTMYSRFAPLGSPLAHQQRRTRAHNTPAWQPRDRNVPPPPPPPPRPTPPLCSTAVLLWSMRLRARCGLQCKEPALNGSFLAISGPLQGPSPALPAPSVLFAPRAACRFSGGGPAESGKAFTTACCTSPAGHSFHAEGPYTKDRSWFQIVLRTGKNKAQGSRCRGRAICLFSAILFLLTLFIYVCASAGFPAAKTAGAGEDRRLSLPPNA